MPLESVGWINLAQDRSGGLLWVWWWATGFHNTRRTSQLVEDSAPRSSTINFHSAWKLTHYWRTWKRFVTGTAMVCLVSVTWYPMLTHPSRQVPRYKVFHSAGIKTANMARMFETVPGALKRSIQAISLILLHLHSLFPFSDTLTVIVSTRSLSSIAPICPRSVATIPAVPLRLNGFT